MTDNRTIELIRKLLEERGLSCQTHYLHAFWYVGPKLYEAKDNLDGTLTVGNLTPEQAIAATLGSRMERKCKSTTDDNAWCFACSECGKSFPRSQLHLAHNHGEINYCPNCGAKVVRQ